MVGLDPTIQSTTNTKGRKIASGPFLFRGKRIERLFLQALRAPAALATARAAQRGCDILAAEVASA